MINAAVSQTRLIKTIKSTPCIEIPTILDADSLSSYISCNTDIEDTESRKSTDKYYSVGSVKALIDKHNSFQDKLFNAKVTNFDIKKRSFANACKDLSESYKDCMNMDGDSERMDNVKNFVKNHMFEVFAPTTHIENPFKPRELDQKVTQTVNFDIKTNVAELDDMVNDMGRRFWEKIVSVVNINHCYYQCLTQIMDTQKFKHLEDVMNHVTLVLKSGKETELIGSELVASCKEHLEKLGIVLDSKLKFSQEFTKNALLSSKIKLDGLTNELAEKKRSMKVAENKIMVLQKEKKDLLNILESYDSENIHKVSLEKRLKAEQDNNKKLREMISSIFNKKIPYLDSNQDRSTH